MSIITKQQSNHIFQLIIQKTRNKQKKMTSTKQLQLHKLLSTPTNTLSQSQKSHLLSLLINQGMDQPDTRFQLAYQLYNANPNTDQKYIQMQQIVYNGLELKVEKNVVRKFVLLMKKKIGDSVYVRRLARFLQFLGNGDVAVMQDLLRDDMSDNETYKKTITAYKKSSKPDQYIQKLNKYLSIEPLDEQAWLELAQLYFQRGHFMKSAFCYQQLILINPQNDIYTLRLSQLYLSLNNKNTNEKAIKYLAYLVTKRPDNLRALWVLYRAIVNINGEEYQELKEMCSEAINKIYSKRNPELKIHVAL